MAVNLTQFLSGQYNPAEIVTDYSFLSGLLGTTVQTPQPPSATSPRAQDIAADIDEMDGTDPASPTSSRSLTPPSQRDGSSGMDGFLAGALDGDDEEIDQSDPDEYARSRFSPAQQRYYETLAENNNVSVNEMLLKSVWDTETEQRDPDAEFGGLDPSRPVADQLETVWEVTPDGERLQGDQYITRVEAVAAYAEAEPDDRGYYQDLLFLSGYTQDPPIAGRGSSSDKTYRKRWADAVRDAAAAGMGVIPYLKQEAERMMESGGRRGSGSGTGRIRPTVQLISDEDADELIEETARATIGRVLSDDERAVVKRITDKIRSTQRTEQNALIDQRMAGGGEAQKPTSVSTLAEQGIEEELETETTGYRVASAFADVARMIGG